MSTVGNWLKSWRLASWRTAVLTAFVLYLVVGIFLVPVVAKKVIVNQVRERTGREVTVGEVRCNPLTLSLTIRDFSFPDRPGSTMLAFDELYANAELSSIFRWAATLKELRVDNPYVDLRVFADGGVNLIQLKDDIEQRLPKAESADHNAGGLPRILLQHILVTGAVVDVEDQAREEPKIWTFGPSRFELRGISTIPDRQGDHNFVIGLESGGTIGVTGDIVLEPLGLDGTVTAEGGYVGRLWSALRPYFKFDMIDGVTSGKFAYSIHLANDGLHALIDHAEFLIEGVEVTAGIDNDTVLKVKSVAVSDASIAWPEGRVRGSSVVVEGVEAFQWIQQDGTPLWEMLVPEKTLAKVVEIYRQVEEAASWDVALDRFEINGSAARLEDRTFPEPLELTADEVNFSLTGFATGPGRRWEVSASAKLMREASATLEGSVDTGPLRVATNVGLENLQLASFQPYVEGTAPVELRSGTISTTGRVEIPGAGGDTELEFTGDLTVDDLDVADPLRSSTLVEWKRVAARGISAGLAPTSLEIQNIDVHDANIEIVLAEDGEINLLEIAAAMAANVEQIETAERTTGFVLPPLRVGKIALDACSGTYTDRSLTPPLKLTLDPVNGTIEGVSSAGQAGATLDIGGTVVSGGQLKVEGESDLLDPKRLSELSVTARAVRLPPISALAVRYLGHTIDEGTGDLDGQYEIINSDLTGASKLVTHDLELGDKVEGEGTVNLPVKLGVSLLTDQNGLITVEFPVEGDLDDPTFALGDIVDAALQKIVSDVVTSPLKLLGRLGGGSGDEDFAVVEFRAGSAVLGSDAAGKLRAVAAGADQRPELVLLVEGAWDEQADADALKQRAFEAELGDQQASVELFESMYRERGPQSDLDALRARNMTTDEVTGKPKLDETAYYHELRVALVDAQPVDAAEVEALGAARAEAVRAFLIDDGGIEPPRVRIISPVALEGFSAAEWVPCRLDVASSG